MSVLTTQHAVAVVLPHPVEFSQHQGRNNGHAQQSAAAALYSRAQFLVETPQTSVTVFCAERSVFEAA